MFANLGPGHWLVLGVVMVVTFAGSKLPDAARYAGQVGADLQVRVA
jgi:Sec-independent protein translocase protein TatA